MMNITDHRTIVGVTWEAAPGLLRRGDYYMSRRHPDVVMQASADYGFVESRRVIPVVTRLALPELRDDDSWSADLVCEGRSICRRDGEGRIAVRTMSGYALFKNRRARRWLNIEDNEVDAVLWVVEGRRPDVVRELVIATTRDNDDGAVRMKASS